MTTTEPDAPAAPATVYPEAEPMVATPEPGTERATEMHGIILADCHWCDGILWSSTAGGWDWEHIDTDTELCHPETATS
jgi:hypothetical protein